MYKRYEKDCLLPFETIKFILYELCHRLGLQVRWETSVYEKDPDVIEHLWAEDISRGINFNIDVKKIKGASNGYRIEFRCEGEKKFMNQFSQFNENLESQLVFYFDKEISWLRKFVILASDSTIHFNLEAYKILYDIETNIRSFIKDKLSEKFGDNWFKHRVPDDIIKNCKIRIDKEKASRWWTTNRKLIDYTDFADLQKIILRRDNWEDVFKPYFKPKKIFEGKMIELEVLRNKIAHSILLNENELEKLRMYVSDFNRCMGIRKETQN